MVITTSKLNNSIVFSHSIFWGTRADEMGPEGRGQGPRIEEHNHPISGGCFCIFFKVIK